MRVASRRVAPLDPNHRSAAVFKVTWRKRRRVPAMLRLCALGDVLQSWQHIASLLKYKI